MKKKNVLFVDDEKMVLDGLRRALRSMRKIINMNFALGGKDALSLLDERPIDILVTDMRMPGMDGAELLNEVKKRHPEVIRMILTGQADDEATKKAIHVAHQFLMKPCDPLILKTVLKRACLFHELITHPLLKRVVSGIDHLPSLPDIYIKIQDAINDPKSSVDDIAAIVEKDLAMSSKLLQLVNSAFFGYYQDIKSPAKAVHILGIETVKSLVLALKVFSQFENGTITKSFLKNLWQHSFETAIFSKAIMETTTDDKKKLDDAFVSGLLHDLGKLILSSNMQEKYAEAIKMAVEQEIELRKAEFMVFKASHAEIGGYLLGIWGLPGDIVEAITFHHRAHQYPGKSFTLAATVACADQISHELTQQKCFGPCPRLDEKTFGTSEMIEKISEWKKLCKKIKERASD